LNALRSFIARAACAVAIVALSACSQSRSSTHAAAPPQRIVSLIPSLTEDLCALGVAHRIVGVSQFSDDIPCVRGVTQVAGFSSIDTERVIALHPDLVVGIPSQRRMAEPLERAGLQVEFLNNDSYADIFTGLTRLGELTQTQHRAKELSEQLKDETARLQRSAHFTHAPRVFVALGGAPIWTVGPSSYIATLLRLAGAQNAVTQLPAAYAQYSAEALVALQPDAILTDNATGVTQLLGREPWRSLHAVQRDRVFVLTDPSILERPGPRYNQGLKWLIERLRPIST